PTIVLHLDVGRKKSISSLEAAMLDTQEIFLATQKEVAIEDPEPEDLYRVGTIAKINQMIKLPNGTIRILVEGLERAEIVNYLETKDEMVVAVEALDDISDDEHKEEAFMRQLLNQFEQYTKLSRKVTKEIVATVVDIQSPSRLTYMIASHVPMKITDKQSILEINNLTNRMRHLVHLLANEQKVLDLEQKIGKRVQTSMERTLKEYYLREQLKAIQKELSEGDGKLS